MRPAGLEQQQERGFRADPAGQRRRENAADLRHRRKWEEHDQNQPSPSHSTDQRVNYLLLDNPPISRSTARPRYIVIVRNRIEHFVSLTPPVEESLAATAVITMWTIAV